MINNYIEYFTTELHLSSTLLLFFLFVAATLLCIGIEIIGKFLKKESKKSDLFASLFMIFLILYITGCSSLLGHKLKESEELYTTVYCDKLKNKIEYKDISCKVENQKDMINQNKNEYSIFLKISLLENKPTYDMFDLSKRKQSENLKSKHHEFYIMLKNKPSVNSFMEAFNNTKEELGNLFNNNIERTPYFKLNKQIDQIANEYNQYITKIVKKEEKYGK